MQYAYSRLCSRSLSLSVFLLFSGHLADIYDLCWSPDGTMIISGSVDNQTLIWDVATRKPKQAFSDHTNFIQGIWRGCDMTTLRRHHMICSCQWMCRCVFVWLVWLCGVVCVCPIVCGDGVVWFRCMLGPLFSICGVPIK